MSTVVSTDLAIAEIKGKLPLSDQEGFIRWVDPDEARELIRSGRVKPVGTKRKIRGLRALRVVPIRGRVYGSSHRKETETNPRGVWTLPRLTERDRDIFARVVRDVASDRAA